MKFKKFLSGVLFFALWNFCVAQNSPVFSNFMNLKQLYNPATAGSDDAMEVFAVYRAQWVGIEGNPSVQALSFSSPLTVIGSSLGVFAVNEFQGEERVTSAMLAYAYKHSFRRWSLSLGVSGGIMQRAIDGARLESPEGDYSSGINHRDDYIPDKLSSGLTGDISAGVFLQMKSLYGGISANNLLESKAHVKWNNMSAEIRNPRYFTACVGNAFKISKKLSLEPNELISTDFINTQSEFNVILQFKDNIYGGLSFRGFTSNLTDALVVMAGFKFLKRFKVGYSYDFSLSSLNLANSGSHEVFVSYKLNIKELLNPGKIIYSPRFL